MNRIHSLERYKDDLGNEILYDGPLTPKADIRFQKGSNNRVIIDARADVHNILVMFCGDNGVVRIGPTTVKRAGLRLELRVGHDSTITVEENVGCAGTAFFSASEGADVTVGRDCMLAKNIEIRTDDTHAIYDVRSGARINVSQSIVVGEHVWLAKHTVVMGGVTIGDGAVVGFRSVVTSDVPNNCVAVGAPARVVRRDIAWERPETPYKRAEETWPKPGGKSERYWKLTDGEAIVAGARQPSAAQPKAAKPIATAGTRVGHSRARHLTARARNRLRRRLGRKFGR